MIKDWTDQERAILKREWEKGTTPSEIARMLNKTADSVKGVARRAKYQRPNTTRKEAPMQSNAANEFSANSYRPLTAAEYVEGKTPQQVIEDMKAEYNITGEPVVKRVLVSPQMAHYLFSLNHKNRRITPSKVEQYKNDIMNGRWKENGEGIAISNTGRMTNGQHRCIAIFETKQSVITNLTYGVEDASQGTNDIGATRRAVHVLDLAGISHANESASITKALIAFEKGDGFTLGKPAEITTPEIEERATNDNLLAKSSAFAAKSKGICRGLITPSHLGLFHYLASKVSSVDEVEDFLYTMLNGCERNKSGIHSEDARMKARTRLFRWTASKSPASATDRYKVVVQAWNAYRKGKKISNFSVNKEIPKII